MHSNKNVFFLSYPNFYKFIIEERRKELKMLLLFRMMEFAIFVNPYKSENKFNISLNKYVKSKL